MHPKVLLKAYENGENITMLMKQLLNLADNSEEIIETAYDLQAGTYKRKVEKPSYNARKVAYGKAIVDQILELTNPGSLLEAGVGEGTTLSYVMSAFGDRGIDNLEVHGFDLSWSRIAECKEWLWANGHKDTFLSVASLLHLPYVDGAFDVVYTSQAIEPNRGKERLILNELFRVTSRYLVLIEPCYELVSEEVRARMDKHGYCRDLPGHAEALGMKVVKYELFDTIMLKSVNPVGILVIEKNPAASAARPQLACPRYGDVMSDCGDSLFSQGSLRAYPKIQGIPCLRLEDGVIASGYDRMRDFLSNVD
ncbi:methyltransferase domain-containing protein [Pseudodesulfovibrio cashew]|uniref:Methyltransferase domain-containing protein n=1 Tax=Pseudodesulfovibrio cashew TaxID=2678688 RepID=A0A6I6JDB4_9BACT|nr:class I SAM-dependent methyltransferase [Pseudodesulfovibrio cashew]QGY38998.1 methyltransferase domain-containing protein [Pseudodesulfovibrio cashew]